MRDPQWRRVQGWLSVGVTAAPRVVTVGSRGGCCTKRGERRMARIAFRLSQPPILQLTMHQFIR